MFITKFIIYDKRGYKCVDFFTGTGIVFKFLLLQHRDIRACIRNGTNVKWHWSFLGGCSSAKDTVKTCITISWTTVSWNIYEYNINVFFPNEGFNLKYYNFYEKSKPAYICKLYICIYVGCVAVYINTNSIQNCFITMQV